MAHDPKTSRSARLLMRLGILLFLLGLATGLAVPALANPRMALSSHLEGLMNGLFLVVLGVIWPRLNLSARAAAASFWLALYGTYVNWATTLAAAMMGAGAILMPMAAQGRVGTPLQEGLVTFGLVSLSLAVLACCGLVLWGLRGSDPSSPDRVQ